MSLFAQIEPNVNKIREHRRKYERLRKERKQKATERERQKTQAGTKARVIVTIVYKIWFSNVVHPPKNVTNKFGIK